MWLHNGSVKETPIYALLKVEKELIN